jgi:hypothetical protein
MVEALQDAGRDTRQGLIFLHGLQVVIHAQAKLRHQGLDQLFVLTCQNHFALRPRTALNGRYHRR